MYRIIDEEIDLVAVAGFGIGFKHKRGTGKPVCESISKPDLSYARGRIVHLQRTIDRENDRYIEAVTDPLNGQVIHECNEPLSEHIRYGSAKRKVS